MIAEFPERPPVPKADYPLLFGGTIPAGFEQAHQLNQDFVVQLIPPPAEGYSPFDRQILVTCAMALTEADHRLGRNVGTLGTMQAPETEGLWYTMPTFYHNGDGTRLAMLGTKQYMDFVNQREGERSPYRDRRIYLATMVTAAVDDIVFGMYGRRDDELASAAIAEEHLRDVGAPEDFIEAVRIGVEASIFDEVSKQQRYNPALGKDLFGGIGSEPVQRGSLIGDLWALGTPQAPVNSFLLMVENLWKRDSALVYPDRQLLRLRAVDEALATSWYGQHLSDFFAVIQKYPDVKNSFARQLIGNEKFLLAAHKYENSGDPRVDSLMMPGKVQSARLQKMLGMAIRENRMTVQQAFHCALSYADAANWRAGRHGAVLGELMTDDVSALLLTVRTPEELANPVDADEFFAAYKREVGFDW